MKKAPLNKNTLHMISCWKKTTSAISLSRACRDLPARKAEGRHAFVLFTVQEWQQNRRNDRKHARISHLQPLDWDAASPKKERGEDGDEDGEAAVLFVPVSKPARFLSAWKWFSHNQIVKQQVLERDSIVSCEEEYIRGLPSILRPDRRWLIVVRAEDYSLVTMDCSRHEVKRIFIVRRNA